MKILHVASKDTDGGACRASFRLHQALKRCSHSSTLFVGHKFSNDPDTFTIQGRFDQIRLKASQFYASKIYKIFGTTNDIYHYGGHSLFNTKKYIDIFDADVINMHWITGGLISIETIAKLNKPVVWTLHDMWLFCGGEHYHEKSSNPPWTNDYKQPDLKFRKRDMPFHFNKRVFDRKKRYLKNPAPVVCSSRWLYDAAKSSSLLRDWPIFEIPYCIDLDIYKPLSRIECRRILNLPQDATIVLTGALGIGYNKGFDLYQKALIHGSKTLSSVHLAVIGGDLGPMSELTSHFKVHVIPRLNDDYTMAIAYGASDFVVMPSRIEAFGQIASEAQACGRPVIAFQDTGVASVVEHGKSGLLCKHEDYKQMSEAIQLLSFDKDLRHSMSNAARERAEYLWNDQRLVNLYMDVYRHAISTFK